MFKIKPRYRVSPRPMGKWGIDRLMPAVFCSVYMPIYSVYDTKEDAEKDLLHLSTKSP